MQTHFIELHFGLILTYVVSFNKIKWKDIRQWTGDSKVHKHQRNYGFHLLCIRTADFILLYRRSLSTPGVFSYLRLSFKAFDILQKRKSSSKTDMNTFYFTKKGCKHVGLTMWFGVPVLVRIYTFVIRPWSLVDNVIWSDRSLHNVLVIYCDPIVRSCTKMCIRIVPKKYQLTTNHWNISSDS